MLRSFQAAVVFLLVFLAPFARMSAENSGRIETLQRRLAAPQPLGVSESAARQELKKILSRPEFAESMRGPTAWERWKQQISEWLMKQFAGLFKAIAKYPTTSEVIFWAFGLGAVGFIAFLLFRLFRAEEPKTWVSSAGHIPAMQDGGDWIKAARSAAERGDLNKGIQCLYWAAVVWLQNRGTLPKTMGLTPRELMRSVPANSGTGELRKLTSSLERFWYACMPATADDFAACLQSLEALGCKPAQPPGGSES